jgi:general secretion pathway protein G
LEENGEYDKYLSLNYSILRNFIRTLREIVLEKSYYSGGADKMPNDTGYYVDKGFTLLEILIVLFLVGLLLGIVVPHYGSSKEKTSELVDQTNIKLIYGAAQHYRLDIGVFPAAVDDLMFNTTGSEHWQGPYLDQRPLNPYDQTKVYHIDNLGQVS